MRLGVRVYAPRPKPPHPRQARRLHNNAMERARIIFVVLLASETLHGRFAIFKPSIASDRT